MWTKNLHVNPHTFIVHYIEEWVRYYELVIMSTIFQFQENVPFPLSKTNIP